MTHVAPPLLSPQPPSAPAEHSCRTWLAVLVLLWGVQAIVTQTLLLREALVLMSGSEFAWGIVLGAWLLGVALGALAGGRLAGRLDASRTAVVLIAVLLVLSAAACVDLWAFRGARGWLGILPGELLPLPQIALAAALFVTPTSVLVGLMFPLACRIGARSALAGEATREDHTPHGAPYLSFGQIYALEAAGSLIGGAVFSFWAVEHLSPIQIALTTGGLCAIASAGFCASQRRGDESSHRRIGPLVAVIALCCVSVAALLAATLAGAPLNRLLVARRWQSVAPGYELVAEAESRYQNLAVGARAGQYSLYCDGHIAADFPDPYSFAPLAHFWLCEHPAPRTVLVLGGGAEGLLAELLRHPVEHIDYVEPDPREIDLIKPCLPDVDRRALADPRVAVHHVDARYFVKTQRDRFDIVIARLPEPTSAQRARFYTAEFFGELRRAMSARAVLCMTAAAAPAELSPLSREYLASLRATLARHFPQIIIGWGDPAPVLVATEPGLLTTDPAELSRRYTQQNVHSEPFDPLWFSGATDWLDPAKLARRAADLDTAGPVPISTDLLPVGYIQRLALWEAQARATHHASMRAPKRDTSGGAADGIISSLRSVRLGELVGVLVLLAAITVLLGRGWRRETGAWADGAITLSVATTGLATMALSILWLYAFQNLYGYVYQRIGWIIALFMAGLVIGSTLANRRRTALSPMRSLIAVDVLLAALAAGVPLVLSVLAARSTTPLTLAIVEWSISALVIITGLLGGAAFVLASRCQAARSGRVASVAGAIVGADHAGACLGALLSGILLVPVFGMAATAYLLAGMKLASALALLGVARGRAGAW